MIKGKFGIYKFEIYHNPYRVVCENDFILDMFDNTCLTLYNPLTTQSEIMTVAQSELYSFLILNHMISLGYDIEIFRSDIKIKSKEGVLH